LDLKQYLQTLREQWFVVVGTALLGVAVAAGIVLSQAPTYASHSQLFVSTADQSDVTATYQGNLFGQQRVKSYADIVSSESVVAAVKKKLRLQASVPQLQKQISAQVPLDTVLINVTVRDKKSTVARDIADSVGQQFSVLVNELETPSGKTASPVKVTVVESASMPTGPISPKKKLGLVIGLIAGLALGLAGALLRRALDTSVGHREEAGVLVGAPVLAAFRDDDSVARRPLIGGTDSFSSWAESFRQLRTNIRYISIDSSVRSMVVTSSVPAEGKTTIAINLAIALAQVGERVILVDADLRRPQVSELMGLNPAIGVTNVLVGSVSLDGALQNWKNGTSLQVLASGSVPPNPSELLSSQSMRELLVDLLARADVVLFDTPPLLPVTDAAVLASMTDGALLVARAGKTKRLELSHSAEALRRGGAAVLGVVLNRVPARHQGPGYGHRYDYPSLRRSGEAPETTATPVDAGTI
jgi:succinoglycan biosynthesis transport protein ExoP